MLCTYDDRLATHTSYAIAPSGGGGGTLALAGGRPAGRGFHSYGNQATMWDFSTYLDSGIRMRLVARTHECKLLVATQAPGSLLWISICLLASPTGHGGRSHVGGPDVSKPRRSQACTSYSY